MEQEAYKQYLKGWRAEVGLLAPVAAMCREFDVLGPDGVRFSRALLGLEEVTPEALKKMSENVVSEAKKLNIGHKMDLLCLGCTSGSFIGGPGYDQKIIKMIEDATGVPATTTTTSVVELLRDLGAKKIALVGPYLKEVFDAEVDFFEAAGFKILTVQWLGYKKTEEYWEYRHNPYPVYKLIRDGHKAAPNADCIFVTCMWSSIMGIVDAAEEEVGKPIISSSSSVMYNILKMLMIPDPVYHYGEALRRPRL
ncbi:Arylmalonate decarboxylase [subsurface metagenome]